MGKRLPGPSALWVLARVRAIQADPLSVLEEARAHFGNLVYLPLGRPGAVLVNEPEAVRHVLQANARNYTKATVQWAQMASIVGEGLLTSEAEVWRKQRRLMQPAFSRSRERAIAEVVVSAGEARLARWLERPWATLDIDREMMDLGLDAVGRALFSRDLRTEASKFTKAVMHALDHMVYRASHLLAPPSFVPTRRNLRFRAALRAIDEAAIEIIRARKASGDDGDDLLGMLLAARDADTGQPMSERELRDEVVTLLVAGHETVSSALTWTLYLLATHDAIRLEVERELASVLGHRPPSFSDVPALVRLGRVVDESLRLYPPAWLVTRKATDADDLLGYEVPRGATIVLSPYLLHRHEAYWPDPKRFDPERFVDGERGAGRPAFSYLPFGGGPRKCIGDRLAKLEAVLVLATLLSRVRLDVAPHQRVEPAPFATVRPRDGLRMTLHVRARDGGLRSPAEHA
jgi:cytochrome P450